MIVAFCIGVAALMACAAMFKYAWEIPSAAGAGAAGSIVLVISGACGIAAIFSFGVAAGLAIAPHT